MAASIAPEHTTGVTTAASGPPLPAPAAAAAPTIDAACRAQTHVMNMTAQRVQAAAATHIEDASLSSEVEEDDYEGGSNAFAALAGSLPAGESPADRQGSSGSRLAGAPSGSKCSTRLPSAASDPSDNGSALGAHAVVEEQWTISAGRRRTQTAHPVNSLRGSASAGTKQPTSATASPPPKRNSSVAEQHPAVAASPNNSRCGAVAAAAAAAEAACWPPNL